MAKENKEPDERDEKREGEHKSEKTRGGRKKRLHLHEIRSVQAHDGSIVHYHTYKEHKEAPFAMPERGPVATSSTPEEAGQHEAEHWAMNGQGAAEPEGGEGEEAEAAQPEG